MKEEREIKLSFIFQDQKRLELFDEALKKQTHIMVENILGQGIDIHLLGLREAAVELTGGLPPIFLDETYRVANRFLLSTSQVLEPFVAPKKYVSTEKPRSHELKFDVPCLFQVAVESTKVLPSLYSCHF